jgi:excisionase family DNA binding protein
MEMLAFTIAQAAKLAGLCRSTLYQEIRAGRLRAVKRGRSTRVLLQDLKTYLGSLPSFHDRANGLPPAPAKQAANRQASDTRASFDFRDSQNPGHSQVDRPSDRGV